MPRLERRCGGTLFLTAAPQKPVEFSPYLTVEEYEDRNCQIYGVELMHQTRRFALRFLARTGAPAFGCLVSLAAFSQQAPPAPDLMQERRALIAQAQSDACGNIATQGSASTTEFRARADATIADYLRRLLDLGFDAGIAHRQSEYPGPSQRGLRAMAKDQQDCRGYVFTQLVAGLRAADKRNLAKAAAPAAASSLQVNQQNQNSNGATAQANGPVMVNVHERPELALTDAQMKTAGELLQKSPDNVRLVLPGPLPELADSETTALGNQMRNLFGKWRVEPVFLGSGPVPPGITVVGKEGTEAVRQVTAAFKAAQISYKLDPNGYTGPGSLDPSTAVTVTISRSVPE